MEPIPRSNSRRHFAVAGGILVVLLLIGIVVSRIIPPSPPPLPLASVEVCAVDPMYARNPAGSANPLLAYCDTGDFQAQNGTQVVLAHAFDASGHPMLNAKISFKVSGANDASGTVTSVNGVAKFSYTGTRAGDDTISATLADGTQTAQPQPAIVRWITPHKYIHPIVFVHGVNEDASEYEIQIDDSFVDENPSGGGRSKQVFTAPIEALKLEYDPAYMKALCYVDDRAYTSNPGNPNACPSSEPSSAPCVSNNSCVSQGPVDADAGELAQVIIALSAAAHIAMSPSTPGTDKVTIVAYSMGGAVTRSLLSGCPSGGYAGDGECSTAANLVDHVFFIDGAQQGSWLLEANKEYDAASAFGASLPGDPNPFESVLNSIQQTLFAKFEQLSQGVNANNPGVQDLTPGSTTIKDYVNGSIPSTVAVYNFYSDVQLRIGVSVLNVPLGGQVPLNLGDFIMLAQDDPENTLVKWGGGGLCDSCSPEPKFALQSNLAPYMPARGSAQFHAWMLLDPHTVDVSALAPNLTVASAQSAFDGVFNSPVWHLNTSQPVTMAPGSKIQVQDVTGRTTHTDIPTEILYVLTHDDQLALP